MEEILKNYGLSEEAIALFLTYKELLLDYNKKINLTAVTEEREVAYKHFLDSLSPLSFIDFKDKSVIDVGTGAGFPGIPLKIAETSISLTLLDSLNKRTVFLNEVIRALGLKNTTAIHARAEEGAHTALRESFDIAVSRAVAELRTLTELCLPYVKVGGLFIALKGPSPENETASAEKAISALGGRLERVERVTLSDFTHTLIFIRKLKPTPQAYPRAFSKIKKSPL